MNLEEQYEKETGQSPSTLEPMYTDEGHSFGEEQYPYTNEFVEWLKNEINELNEINARVV